MIGWNILLWEYSWSPGRFNLLSIKRLDARSAICETKARLIKGCALITRSEVRILNGPVGRSVKLIIHKTHLFGRVQSFSQSFSQFIHFLWERIMSKRARRPVGFYASLLNCDALDPIFTGFSSVKATGNPGWFFKNSAACISIMSLLKKREIMSVNRLEWNFELLGLRIEFSPTFVVTCIA